MAGAAVIVLRACHELSFPRHTSLNEKRLRYL
jgi:hypothetical protein